MKKKKKVLWWVNGVLILWGQLFKMFKEQSLGEAIRHMIPSSQGKELGHPSCRYEMESPKTLTALQKRTTRAPPGRLLELQSCPQDSQRRWRLVSWPWMCTCLCVGAGETGGVPYFCCSHRQTQERYLYRRKEGWLRNKVSGECEQPLLWSPRLPDHHLPELCCAGGAVEEEEGGCLLGLL